MRTMEPSTKCPDNDRGGAAELFFLLGTSDEGSFASGLLEAGGVGVEVLPLEVAILAASPFRPHGGFRSPRPSSTHGALTSRSRANCAARDAACEPAPRLRSPARRRPWARPAPPRPGPGSPRWGPWGAAERLVEFCYRT